MKKTVTIISMLVSSIAIADGVVDGTVVDHFEDRTTSVPYSEYTCNTVKVPVYGHTSGREASTFDKLGGAIIGGAIGNQFGGGSGKDALTLLGAFAGADIAEQHSRRGSSGIVGYRYEEQCGNERRFRRETKTMYSHSTVKFNHEGRTYELRFQK